MFFIHFYKKKIKYKNKSIEKKGKNKEIEHWIYLRLVSKSKLYSKSTGLNKKQNTKT